MYIVQIRYIHVIYSEEQSGKRCISTNKWCVFFSRINPIKYFEFQTVFLQDHHKKIPVKASKNPLKNPLNLPIPKHYSGVDQRPVQDWKVPSRSIVYWVHLQILTSASSLPESLESLRSLLCSVVYMKSRQVRIWRGLPSPHEIN